MLKLGKDGFRNKLGKALDTCKAGNSQVALMAYFGPIVFNYAIIICGNCTLVINLYLNFNGRIDILVLKKISLWTLHCFISPVKRLCFFLWRLVGIRNATEYGN